MRAGKEDTNRQCDRCLKKNVETKKMYDKNNQRHTVNLCQQCYNMDRLIQPLENILKQFGHVLQKLLHQCIETRVCGILNEMDTAMPVRCGICGITWQQYKMMNRPTCSCCQISFRSRIRLLRPLRDHDDTKRLRADSFQTLQSEMILRQFDSALQCLNILEANKKHHKRTLV